jgi:hypothetical protein
MERQFDSAWWRLWIAGFMALLIVGMGFVQSIHLHNELAPHHAAHSHCALCVISHSPAVVTAARSAPAPVSDFAAFTAAEPQLHSRLLIASAFIRPPPTV